MSEVREHRGVVYLIPSTDSGVWHYKIHPGRLRAGEQRPVQSPIDGYSTRDAAVKAAEQEIDIWLSAIGAALTNNRRSHLAT